MEGGENEKKEVLSPPVFLILLDKGCPGATSSHTGFWNHFEAVLGAVFMFAKAQRIVVTVMCQERQVNSV